MAPKTFVECVTRETTREVSHVFSINISSVVEFQRWWVLKSKIFGQESKYSLGLKKKKIIGGMSVHQKLEIILENKVVQKLLLEKNVCPKNWPTKLIFLN